ncbi:hypothetical protein F0562_028137 [Nyssa sinensis]|uniref:Protein kinase domain-containing protein n=1 Tax=Nyssa sinensis TaxID=561372 RepID=A0A5J5B977_9ASTE|nr:hypothetical protein F0562_028137 [Nyssa sinensis]
MGCLRVQLITLQILVILSSVAIAAQATAAIIAKPGCDDHCGNVSIPYPFGMTQGCYLDDVFLITCDNSSIPPKPIYGSNESNLNVTKIDVVEGQLHILNYIAYDCYAGMRRTATRYSGQTFLDLGKFTISSTKNKFTAVGCDTYAVVRGWKDTKICTTGCFSICDGIDSVVNGSCSGIGCCQVSIPNGLQGINLTLSSYYNHTDIIDFNPCSFAFVTDEFNFSSNLFSDLQHETDLPLVADWTIGNETCEVAQKDQTSYACVDKKSTCYEPDSTTPGSGYRCNCSAGYRGNPYISGGCQDIDECAEGSHNCEKDCINTVGNYNCTCPPGYHGDGRRDGERCQDIDECANPSLNKCKKNCFNTVGSYTCRDQSRVIKLAVGLAIGSTALLVGISWLYFGFKKRKLDNMRKTFFEQNGGPKLQKLLVGREGSTESIRIFTAKELEKASNNYDRSRILGRGGYGTVYKGELAGKTIAIKKFKIVDKSLTEQFINEVVVLSQINHRNVVKLLGCCLETQIPSLVYEFVNNGTLFHNIHDNNKASVISWDIRLRIATETAEVLSYLHSAASTPIIHGDVKSANILLDDKYTAKVSDFGASRLAPSDQTQLSTIVQGTLGYLDPEYLQTSQMTEKSDVYSFGVVLAELLTGKNAFSFDKPGERTLATYFLTSLKEGSLVNILDDILVHAAEQLEEVANLAMRCLTVKGDERPTMKEVAMELEALMRKAEKHPWISNESITEEKKSLLGEQLNVGTSTTNASEEVSYC